MNKIIIIKRKKTGVRPDTTLILGWLCGEGPVVPKTMYTMEDWPAWAKLRWTTNAPVVTAQTKNHYASRPARMPDVGRADEQHVDAWQNHRAKTQMTTDQGRTTKVGWATNTANNSWCRHRRLELGTRKWQRMRRVREQRGSDVRHKTQALMTATAHRVALVRKPRGF